MSNMVDPDARGALLYRTLIAAAPLGRVRVLERYWDWAWQHSQARFSGSTTVEIHGFRAEMNVGFAYPAFRRRWTTYNMPLVSAVVATRSAATSPIDVVDVGAAVGDTAILLMSMCREACGRLICVEGDDEFLNYLQHNVREFPQVDVRPAVVSDQSGEIPSLVRTHLGTAAAQGATKTQAVTLDSVLDGAHVDVLKTDTDGWDGRVLGGALATLRRDAPVVVFEWAPLQLAATGNRWQLPFEVLHQAGYDTFVWFDKFGRFSHVDGGDVALLGPIERMCACDEGPAVDWHFDVIALHPDRKIELAQLARTRADTSPPCDLS